MDGLWKDFRFAIRTLLNSPGFSLVALLALVLGIGANTAIFSVVNAVLLRPLPFQEPGRLAVVLETNPRHTSNVANPQNVADWQRLNRSFEKIAAYVPFQLSMSITGEGTPEEVPGNYATIDFFPTLGIQPALGRNFVPEEDSLGAPDVAIISDGLWRRRYASDPKIVGKQIIARGKPTTIVGVLPASFKFPEVKADIWELASLNPKGKRTGRYLAAIGRLKPNVSTTRAQADMDVIAAQLAKQFP